MVTGSRGCVTECTVVSHRALLLNSISTSRSMRQLGTLMTNSCASQQTGTAELTANHLNDCGIHATETLTHRAVLKDQQSGLGSLTHCLPQMPFFELSRNFRKTNDGLQRSWPESELKTRCKVRRCPGHVACGFWLGAIPMGRQELFQIRQDFTSASVFPFRSLRL